MASRCTTRMLAVSAALLLSGTVNAALLSGSDANGIEPDAAARTPQLLAGWTTVARPSGTTGGALRVATPTWLPEATPIGPIGGQISSSAAALRPMLGGLGADYRGSALEDQQIPPVALPAALWLFGSGAAAVLALLYRRAGRASARAA